MVQSNQLHPGLTITIGKKLLRVESSIKVTAPKGAPFIKTKLRDLATDKISEKNFKLNEEIQDVALREKRLEFLYLEGKDYLFMDIAEFEHILVPEHVVAERANFLKEGVEVSASLYDDRVFSITLPQFLEIMVSKVTGAESESPLTNSTRHAILETGAKVVVPPFIEEGDIIKVDTKSGEYIQRI